MTENKQVFYSSDNGISRIRTLLWTDDAKEPEGIVQIVPSFGDHIGRYDEFARFLSEKGFIVCGADHVGHGGSVNSASELGAVNDKAHLTVVRDMHTLWRIMHRKYPSLPYYMVGVGVGSFAVRIFAGAFPDALAGAVFAGTSQIPDFAWAFADPAQTLLEKLPRDLSSGEALNVLFGRISRRLYKDNNEYSWLSENEDNQLEYLTDPLTGFQMTRQLWSALIELLLRGSRASNAYALPPDFKVMFVSGAKDSVGLFGRGVISASDIYAAAGMTPEVILYPVMRHEILQETDRERVFNDIYAFLMKKEEVV